MRRAREARKRCCVGVDLPIEAGTCGRMVHAESQRCIHFTKRRWWLLNHALNNAEMTITAILEDHTVHSASEDDTLDDLGGVVPTLAEPHRPQRPLPPLVGSSPQSAAGVSDGGARAASPATIY